MSLAHILKITVFLFSNFNFIFVAIYLFIYLFIKTIDENGNINQACGIENEHQVNADEGKSNHLIAGKLLMFLKTI